jgi:hypothetical protein
MEGYCILYADYFADNPLHGEAVFSSAVIWSLWTLRNEFCFHGKTWTGLDLVLGKVVVNVKNWRLLCKDAHTSLLDQNLMLLEKTRGELLRIAWR